MNFGTVTFTGKYWVVKCEPNVRARMRRVFPRVKQQASSQIEISDSPEHCRELEWFLQRYPMTVSDPERLRVQAGWHIEQETKLAQLFASKDPPPPVDLAEPARDYQLFAGQLLELKRGLLLADDVGLGKTVSSMVAMTNPANIPAVVVCPAHLTRQWELELKRFMPSRIVYRIRTGKVRPLVKEGLQRTMLDRPPEILIVSYHMLRTWAETLATIIRYVVFDECQQLRHQGTYIAQACHHVARAATLRLGLSATPIHNYGSEFHPVIDTLVPDAFGTHEEFIREWCSPAPGQKSRLSDAQLFGQYLRREGLMLRRTRADVKRELPPLARILHTIDCDPKVLEKAESAAVALARTILSANESYRGARMQAAGELDLLLRQATGVAKAPYVAEFVKLLIENGETHVVVFAWHREVYAILQERLKDLKPLMYTGSESGPEKAANIQSFKMSKSAVLLMSLRSGAGVDGLQQVCRTVVFAELDWSPAVHEQCMGRVNRDGQPDPVDAYFLLSEEGTDPIIAPVLGLKREQLESVRNPDTALAEVIDTGENNLRRLARDLLTRRGIPIPDEPSVLELRASPAEPALSME